MQVAIHTRPGTPFSGVRVCPITTVESIRYKFKQYLEFGRLRLYGLSTRPTSVASLHFCTVNAQEHFQRVKKYRSLRGLLSESKGFQMMLPRSLCGLTEAQLRNLLDKLVTVWYTLIYFQPNTIVVV